MRDGTIEWRADRVKLLDKFAAEVADGIWHKMPYGIWRGLVHNKAPDIYIKKNEKENEDGTFTFSLKVAILSLEGTNYTNGFVMVFSEKDDFGKFLYNNFGSSALTYKEADESMYNNAISNIPYNPEQHSWSDPIIINNGDYSCWDNSATSIIKKTLCDENDVRRICEDIINNKDKENKKMDTSNLFNFDFGPASSNQFRMSPYGLAVRTQANGWVAYNAKTGDLMDVDILNFDISKMIYKMPVALTAIKPGDILMHCGKPVFVREVATGSNTVHVIDYTNATVAGILPVKSPFGFNFFTKVCPLFNFDQASANSDNPFGNMLPFLMLNSEKDGSFDPALLFMASAMNGGNMDFASNPMMLYCLMSRQDKGDILPFLMMMNGGLTGMGVSTPVNSTAASVATSTPASV